MPEHAEDQWVPLNCLNRRFESVVRASGREFYPVCYRSAKASKTLRMHYRGAAAGSTFARDAYSQVVDLLRIRNSPSLKPPAMLFECSDFGPAATPTADGRTILATLQSSEYRAFIEGACEELSRFAAAYKGTVDMPAGRLRLQNLLTGTLPTGMTQQYPQFCGNIHGDANSRNFLFTTNVAGAPSGLQVIDCGCHSTDAPLLFDPAQLESDLKVNLMASELKSGYEEIDVARLPEWVRMERLSLDGPFAFKIPAHLPDSVQRAYGIVKLIRERVQEISPLDAAVHPDPRPYFHFLLYWTLRKLRHTAVPPNKRLFVLASVFLLLERLQ